MLELVVAGFEPGTSLQDHHQSQSISQQASFLWFLQTTYDFSLVVCCIYSNLGLPNDRTCLPTSRHVYDVDFLDVSLA